MLELLAFCRARRATFDPNAAAAIWPAEPLVLEVIFDGSGGVGAVMPRLDRSIQGLICAVARILFGILIVRTEANSQVILRPRCRVRGGGEVGV